MLHGESSKRLATPRNTKDKKHLQSTQSAQPTQPTNLTDQAPSTAERTTSQCNKVGARNKVGAICPRPATIWSIQLRHTCGSAGKFPTAAACDTEKATNAWHRHGTQKTQNTNNQHKRPPIGTDHRPTTRHHRKGSQRVKSIQPQLRHHVDPPRGDNGKLLETDLGCLSLRILTGPRNPETMHHTFAADACNASRSTSEQVSRRALPSAPCDRARRGARL